MLGVWFFFGGMTAARAEFGTGRQVLPAVSTLPDNKLLMAAIRAEFGVGMESRYDIRDREKLVPGFVFELPPPR